MGHCLYKNGGNMNKIINKSNLKNLKKLFKGKTIGLCHGAFDIIHIGHLEHFEYAKSKVDKLVVSVTSKKFIKKGPNNPYNDDTQRLNFLRFIDLIDFIYLDQNYNAENIINLLKPDYYFKGKDYRKKDISENLEKEIKVLKKNNGKFIITNTNLKSSTKIINNIFSNFSKEQINYLKKISNDGFRKIEKSLENVRESIINIIGDPIIDKYVTCELSGMTSKDPAISTIVKKKNSYPGGVLPVAMIISKFVKQVNLYTYGKNQLLKNFTKKFKNIKIFNLDKNSKIQIKTRYLNANRYEKLLQVTNIKKTQPIFNHNTINKLFKSNQNIIICDFGIGLFNKDLIKKINFSSSKNFINVQTNSINFGENLINKYKKLKYISLDKREWLLSGIKIDGNFKKKIKDIYANSIKSITLGKEGSKLISKNREFYAPVFISKTIDTTGCGDAYFAITSLAILGNLNHNLIPFAGNLYAGLHGEHVGNSKIIDKITYFNLI